MATPLVSRRAGVLAYAKQTAVGTPATAPTFAVPKVGGGVGPARDRADLGITRATSARAGQYIQRARGEGEEQILAHPDELGLLLYLAMGTQAVAGAAVPYTHTFTLGDNLPTTPLTIWDLVGDDWLQFTDAYINRLVLQGATGENVLVTVGFTSKQVKPVSAPTYTIAPDEPRFKYIGSTVKLEADNATPVTLDNVDRVELTIDRSPEWRYGPSLTPEFVIPVRNVDFTAGLFYDAAQQGWDFFRAARFGSVAATEMEQGLSDGSFEVTFGRHPADATRFLRIAGNGRNWEYDTDRPESDPGGGAIELPLTGIVKQPAAGGTEVTVTLVNETAGLY